MAIRITGRQLVDTVGTEDRYRYTRIAVLELMSRAFIRYKIDGATEELGVYRGVFAKLINHFFPDKKFYLFDTFEGFDNRDTSFDIKTGSEHALLLI